MRTPPQNIDSEKIVLGTLLQRSELYDEALLHCKSSDFYLKSHRTIFDAIDADSDAVVVVSRLRDAGLADAGVVSQLAELMDIIPSPSMLATHAGIVREAARKRSFLDSAERLIDSCYSGMPFDHIAAEIESEAFLMSSGVASSEARLIGDIAMEELSSIKNVHDGKVDPGLMTGFADLDFMLSGLQPADLIILAGRPSMGKSALAYNILVNICSAGIPGAFFSLEMSNRANGQRSLSMFSGINSKAFRSKGFISDHQWPKLEHAAGELAKIPLFIDPSAGLSVAEIRSRGRRLFRNNRVKIIVVDYLQMISGKGQSREQEVSHVSRELKAMAKELDIPVIAVAQLNRASEQKTNKRPMISELRDSGGIEQDADIIMLIYRDDYYDQNSRDKGISEVIIGKQRNGPTGVVKLGWVEVTTSFRNLDLAHEV